MATSPGLARRVPTPRPSVSPLSSRSPEATRDTVTSSAAVIPPPEPEPSADDDAAENGELQDDRSSSLSEPEDDEDEEDEEEPIREVIGTDGEGARRHAHESQDGDSEAETERLDQTPHTSRQHADSIVPTPSKLSQAATLDEELSEPPSPLQMDIGAASSTSTIGALGVGKKRKRSEDGDSPLTSAESDLGESPRKRSFELPPPNAEDEGAGELDTANGTAGGRPENVQDAAEPVDSRGTPAPIAIAKTVKGKKGKPKGRKTRDAPPETEAYTVEDEPAPKTDEPTAEPTTTNPAPNPLTPTAATATFATITRSFAAFRDLRTTERLRGLDAELALLSLPTPHTSAQTCIHPEYLRQLACVDARRARQVREARAYEHYRRLATRQRALAERSAVQSAYHQRLRELREKVMEGLGAEWCGIQGARRGEFLDNGEGVGVGYGYAFPAERSARVKQQARYNREVAVLAGVARYVGFPAAPEIKGAEGVEGGSGGGGGAWEDDLRAMKVGLSLASASTATQPTTTAPRAATPLPAQPATQHRQDQPAYHPRPLPPTATPAAHPTPNNEALAHQQYIDANAWARPQPLRAGLHHVGTLVGGPTHTPDWVDRPAGGDWGAGRGSLRDLQQQQPPPPRDGDGDGDGGPYATPLLRKGRPWPPPAELSSGGTVGVGSDGVEAPGSRGAAPATIGDRVTAVQQQHAAMGPDSPLHVAKQRAHANGSGAGGGAGTGAEERDRERTGYRNISNLSNVSAASGASTIDAPPQLPDSAEKEREREMRERDVRQGFDGSHRFEDWRRQGGSVREKDEGAERGYPVVPGSGGGGGYGGPAPLGLGLGSAPAP
ncbi:hypothetical protein LTR53_014780 [Teratosphaeriaceae sp. CCFEE 6253]|nr:hypothetical protein LTR53_014780 [Teratosphaeriaceae sp. CCFEE 6253]